MLSAVSPAMMLCGAGHQRFFEPDCYRGSFVSQQPNLGGTKASAGYAALLRLARWMAVWPCPLTQ